MIQNVSFCHSYYHHKTTISEIRVTAIFMPKIFRYSLGHFLVLGLRNFQAEASLLSNDCHSGLTGEKDEIKTLSEQNFRSRKYASLATPYTEQVITSARPITFFSSPEQIDGFINHKTCTSEPDWPHCLSVLAKI